MNSKDRHFFGTGLERGYFSSHGDLGNAPGAFMCGGEIEVFGNVQHAAGDTMNGGSICIHGNAGNYAGCSMSGGTLYIRGNAAGQAGIHIKKDAVVLIGGNAGDFFGEYQAGGAIIVLGLNSQGPLLGASPCAGMHGGKVYLRGQTDGLALPDHVTARMATSEDMEAIVPHLQLCAHRFGWALEQLLDTPFTVLTPQTHRPYKSMYTAV